MTRDSHSSDSDEARLPLCAGQVLAVLAPHPDDESIATGGLIAVAVAAGITVQVILATDGNRRGLGRYRSAEVRRAVRALGLPEGHLHQLGHPDGGLAGASGVLRASLSRYLSAIRPDLLIAPHQSDRHPDHAALGAAGEDWACGAGVPLWSYLVHYSGFPAPRRWAPALPLLPPTTLSHLPHRSIPLTTSAQARKRTAILQHRTQLWVPRLRSLLLAMDRQSEPFFVVSQGVSRASQ